MAASEVVPLVGLEVASGVAWVIALVVARQVLLTAE
jgi:hypothetical protein